MSDKISHTRGPWSIKNLQVHKTGGNQICKLWVFKGEEWRGNGRLIYLAPTAPHSCDDPKCPGNINRQKLEMFDDMVDALDYAYQGYTEFNRWHALVVRARALMEASK